MTFGKRNEHVFLGRDFGHERDYGERVATIIDEEITRIINEQYQRVKELIVNHKPHMEEIVRILLDKETLDGAEFDAIIRDVNCRLGLPTDAVPPSDSGSGDTIATRDNRQPQSVGVSNEDKEQGDGGALRPKCV